MSPEAFGNTFEAENARPIELFADRIRDSETMGAFEGAEILGVAGLRAAIEGIKQRGNTDLGDKTLLDSLSPAVDELDECDLTAVRSLVGLLRQARLRHVAARTVMIERVSPLEPADEAYLLEAIFKNSWGERLRPYLSANDYVLLGRLCDPKHREFALRRADFHFLQSFTLAVGKAMG